MAPALKEKRAANYSKYFSEVDIFYRSFNAACKAAIKKGVGHGPTVSQFAGALMGMKDKSEAHLPQSWIAFAEEFPESAMTLRRSVADLRLADESRFSVSVPDDLPKAKKGLMVYNNGYPGGMPRVEDGKLSDDIQTPESAESIVSTDAGGKKKRQRKPKAKAPKKRAAMKKAGRDDSEQEDDNDVDYSDLDSTPSKKIKTSNNQDAKFEKWLAEPGPPEESGVTE